MGCISSKEPKMDRVLVAAVKNLKVKPRKKHGKFNELLLKLPTLQRGFNKMKEVFKEMDEGNSKAIFPATLQGKAHLLGLHPHDAQLADVLTASDVTATTQIDVDDFIIILTIVHLQRPESEETKLLPDISATLIILEEFFVYFDESKDGYLERKEISAAADEDHSAKVGRNLFDQLDWDGNGSISFREFILGLCRIASFDDEED